jgi:hypothetical protein
MPINQKTIHRLKRRGAPLPQTKPGIRHPLTQRKQNRQKILQPKNSRADHFVIKFSIDSLYKLKSLIIIFTKILVLYKADKI